MAHNNNISTHGIKGFTGIDQGFSWLHLVTEALTAGTMYLTGSKDTRVRAVS